MAAMERQTAAEAERSRLARDMHDSLAKTVSGIGFAALALARRIERDPAAAADEARRLAEDARTATIEARELITGLRGEEGRAMPLPVALRTEAERWSAGSRVPVSLAIEDVGELDAVAARELEWILREALRNVERHAGAGRVGVRLRTLGGRAVLTVADDGAGFEVPDDLAELASGRHFGVTGMRERAQLAGGDVSVESAPGEGCVLSVWVPAPAAPRDAPAVLEGSDPFTAAATAPSPRAGGVRPLERPARRAGVHMAVIRVLLVDDNAIVRRGIASLLSEADGIEVVGQAADGREAVAVARETRPDVVCLDVRMPVMDGVAAAKPLSERSKVLMLSYSEEEPLVTGAIANGASGYLVHGRFEPEELETRIKAIARGEMVLSPAVTPAVFDALRRAPGPANDEREEGLGLAHRARARGPQPAGARALQPRHRGGARDHQQDREEPPQPHLREDRRALPRRGDRPVAGGRRALTRAPLGPRSQADLGPRSRPQVEPSGSGRGSGPNVAC